MTSQNGSYSYYLLLYGKASAVGSNGLYDVSIKTVLACTSGASFYSYNTSHNGKIDGSTAFSGTYAPSNAWELSSFTEGGVTYKIGTVLGEGSSYVDTGGSAQSVSLSSTFSFKANGASYTPASGVSRTVTEYATLPATIVATKAILLTAPDFNDEENPTITYSNTSGSSVSALEACIGWEQGQDNIKYRAISKTKSSYTFTLTDAERELLKNACQNSNSLTVKFYLKTTIGSNIYYDVLTRTFTIAGANPIVTGSVIDTNEATIALTGDSSKLIKFFSSAQATMSAEAQKGAAIDENLYIIRNGSNTGYGTTHTFNNVESNLFNFSAEDSRGNVGTASVTVPMINYTKLTCNITHDRLDLQGNVDFQCSGNYFNNSFGAEDNTLTVQYRYKEYDGVFSEWTDMAVTKVGNGYYATASLTGLDCSKTYSFEAKATDKLTTITSANASVKNMPVFHWGKDDFVFEVPVTFKKGATIETDQIIENGVWLPALNSSAISYYTTRYGWYSQIGQTVTIGFYIKATCNSGYENTNISISGLPFFPSYSVAGGGMCSGAYISAGFNFQCFVVGTDGAITTRVQACNNTTAENLSTSASGCFYSHNGGELTLSGTITFMANS